MKTTESTRVRIKAYEGLRLTTYICPAGVPTIGYGHTGPDVRMGMTITEAKASSLFIRDLEPFESWVSREFPSATQGQFDALVSFVYNCGIVRLQRSTLYRKAKLDMSDSTIPCEFKKYVRGGGKVLPGLVKRRAWEAELYQSHE